MSPVSVQLNVPFEQHRSFNLPTAVFPGITRVLREHIAGFGDAGLDTLAALFLRSRREWRNCFNYKRTVVPILLHRDI